MTYHRLQHLAAQFVAAQTSAGSEVLIVASVRTAADEIVRPMCRDALVGVHRFAFRDLAHALSSRAMNENGLVPVSRIVRESLAARVTANLHRENQLQYLHGIAGFPGFARALTGTLEELRLNRIAPDALRGCGLSGPDLALLLESYRLELAERRLADHAARVELALEAVRAGRHRFAQMPVLALAVEPRSVAEKDLLRHMLARAPASLELNPEPSGAAISNALESLQHYVLVSELVPERPPDATVEIFSASGEALECVEIARRIGAAAAAGTPFDSIAILLRSSERYQPLMLEALRRARIPAYCSRGVSRPDASGRAFLSLLYCAQEGLSASRFAEYMSLGQMPAANGEPRTPLAWERLLVDSAVVGGKRRWESRLRGIAEELHRLYRAAEDDAERNRCAFRIESVEALAAFALPLVDTLARFPARAAWGEWLDLFHDLAASSLRHPAAVQQLLAELAPMSAVGPVSLSDVLLVLSDRLSTVRGEPRGGRYGKVFVAGIEEARGLSFHTVFLPGVNEGMFPRHASEDPLLLDEQRSHFGILPRLDDADLLRIACACARERFVLSFSRLDLLTGRARVPSFYAFEVHRAAGGRDLDVFEFESHARARTETRIGWPAPSDPRTAIDDTEYDLSTLAPRQPGAGGYLKHLPGRAVEALRARWWRWHKQWKPVDGLIVEEIGSHLLESYRPIHHAFSPSALQQFARCPYRFALRAIYGLHPAGRPAGLERLDPATRGEIYHRVQFDLLRDLEARGLLPVTSANLALVLERLDCILDQTANVAEMDLVPAIPQIWTAEVESLRTDLRGWLQYKATVEPDWTPIRFELGFGLQDRTGRDPHSRGEPVELPGGFRLAGSIDLIERHAAGALRVVDHKTGKMPEPRPETLGGGEVLQPALYALAAERLLDEEIHCGRLFFSTLRQNYRTIDVPLHDFARQRAEQVLRSIDHALRDGFLPAAPRKDACKRCEYQPVCGPYEEERVAKKSQPELKALKDIRSWR